jgi:hypothetical protein
VFSHFGIYLQSEPRRLFLNIPRTSLFACLLAYDCLFGSKLSMIRTDCNMIQIAVLERRAKKELKNCERGVTLPLLAQKKMKVSYIANAINNAI